MEGGGWWITANDLFNGVSVQTEACESLIRMACSLPIKKFSRNGPRNGEGPEGGEEERGGREGEQMAEGEGN